MAETTTKEGASRQCPAGCGPLTPFVYRDVNLNHCLACAGIWFDVDECPRLEAMPEGVMDALDDLVTPASVPSERRASAGRDCPNCGVLLSPYSYHVGQVVTVDRCDLCDGFWADHGEIKAINDSLVARAHGPVHPDMIAKTKLSFPSAALTDQHIEHGHIFQAFAVWLNQRGTS